VSVESVEDHRDPGFDAALRLYARVFPSSERIDRGRFKHLLEEKRLGVLFPFNMHFLIARRGRQVVGLATRSYLAVVNMGFVAYLAVAPELKGGRIGSRLRGRLVREMRRDARAAGRADLDLVLGEVEADNRWLRYLVRRHRALALDLDYYQPGRAQSGLKVA
jgi:Acetyltransferase (GNAT) family